jgi:hypothetical protein
VCNFVPMHPTPSVSHRPAHTIHYLCVVTMGPRARLPVCTRRAQGRKNVHCPAFMAKAPPLHAARALASPAPCPPCVLVCLCACVRACRIGLRIFAAFGLFELKPVTVMQILPLAACYALCTPLSNLSLAFNSVGFYQMMKILTTPYVAVIESVFYGAKFTTPIKVSLGIVTLGVLMASVNDVEVGGGGAPHRPLPTLVRHQLDLVLGCLLPLTRPQRPPPSHCSFHQCLRCACGWSPCPLCPLQVNFIGTVYAVACMVVTAQYQIYVGQKQKELGLNSTQLLMNMVLS